MSFSRHSKALQKSSVDDVYPCKDEGIKASSAVVIFCKRTFREVWHVHSQAKGVADTAKPDDHTR